MEKNTPPEDPASKLFDMFQAAKERQNTSKRSLQPPLPQSNRRWMGERLQQISPLQWILGVLVLSIIVLSWQLIKVMHHTRVALTTQVESPPKPVAQIETSQAPPTTSQPKIQVIPPIPSEPEPEPTPSHTEEESPPENSDLNRPQDDIPPPQD